MILVANSAVVEAQTSATTSELHRRYSIILMN